jgi:hypothetical protein
MYHYSNLRILHAILYYVRVCPCATVRRLLNNRHDAIAMTRVRSLMVLPSSAHMVTNVAPMRRGYSLLHDRHDHPFSALADE